MAVRKVCGQWLCTGAWRHTNLWLRDGKSTCAATFPDPRIGLLYGCPLSSGACLERSWQGINGRRREQLNVLGGKDKDGCEHFPGNHW